MSGPSADEGQLGEIERWAMDPTSLTDERDLRADILLLLDRLGAAEARPSADAVRALIEKWFEDYQTTARQARFEYEAGAAERHGTEAQAYLDYARSESVKAKIAQHIWCQLDALLSATIPPAPAQALIERLQWARSFIEYARVQLQPGETQPSDPFPRQSAADLAMSEIDGVIDALHSLTIPPEQTKEHGV